MGPGVVDAVAAVVVEDLLLLEPHLAAAGLPALGVGDDGHQVPRRRLGDVTIPGCTAWPPAGRSAGSRGARRRGSRPSARTSLSASRRRLQPVPGGHVPVPLLGRGVALDPVAGELHALPLVSAAEHPTHRRALRRHRPLPPPIAAGPQAIGHVVHHRTVKGGPQPWLVRRARVGVGGGPPGAVAPRPGPSPAPPGRTSD